MKANKALNNLKEAVFITLLLIMSTSNLLAQSNRDFDYSFLWSDTLIAEGGEYYTSKTFPTDIKLHWYGSFIVDDLGEKIPIGKHLLFYPVNLIEHNVRIQNVDTNRVEQIWYYNHRGNFEKSVHFNYSDRKIQGIYFPPPKENEERENEYAVFLSDTLLSEKGKYYYSYSSGKAHKYYGSFIRKKGKKIPVGKHLEFYYETLEDDEYRQEIKNFDTSRVKEIYYYDENGVFHQSVLIYYTSRSLQYIGFYLLNNEERINNNSKSKK